MPKIGGKCQNSKIQMWHFEWTKVHKKCQKIVNLASFWKPEAWGQTVLPDRSILIRQKLMENAKIEKLEMRLFGWFSNTVLLMSWQESDSKSVSNPHNGQDYLKSKRTVLWLDILTVL